MMLTPGVRDARQRGILAINPTHPGWRERLQSQPRDLYLQLDALFLHEAYPGHHAVLF
jgi:uncharacterized protein (DUF885 family)